MLLLQYNEIWNACEADWWSSKAGGGTGELGKQALCKGGRASLPGPVGGEMAHGWPAPSFYLCQCVILLLGGGGGAHGGAGCWLR